MSAGQPRSRGCRHVQKGAALRQYLRRLAVPRIADVVRVMLLPLQRAFGPVNAQAQPVQLARRHLAAPVRTVDAVLILHEDVVVVVELLAVAVHRGAQALYAQAREVVNYVLHVRADVAHRVAYAGELRVRAPNAGVHLALAGELVQQPVLHIFRAHGYDVPDVAAAYHLPHDLHHVVAGIGVCNGKHQAALLRQAAEFLRLRDLKAQRLFADHVHAREQKLAADLVVDIVRRADGDKVYLVLASRGLRLHHLAPVCIQARGVNVEPLSTGRILLRVSGKAAAHQADPRVQHHRAAVYVADEAAQVAAYHSAAQFLTHALGSSFPGRRR